MENIYAQIAQRTGGNIYIGVVGPVRTGKSTLIKRIMELMVIPNIEDPYRRERARDELPQSGSGKTIMTSEPKFVPEEAVQIQPDEQTQLSVRLIDSVGYMVEGAVGAMEDGVPRMVTTPWYDYEIPLTEAAELGTQKVMQEHCTLGLVVTTDATITDIPRADYEEAEDRAIRDMQQTGKPFCVIINTKEPKGEKAKQLQESIKEKYGIQARILDCQGLNDDQVKELLKDLLYAFPLEKVLVYLPKWLDALDNDHPLKKTIYDALLHTTEQIHTLSQADYEELTQLEQISAQSIRIDPATGTVTLKLELPQHLFYSILSDKAGLPIEDDAQLLKLLTELKQVKTEYDKLSNALESVNATGYGIVMPQVQDMTLHTPELLKKGSAYGVKLRSSAPSIHMIRVDIDTEISPMVGSEQQSKELVAKLSGEDAAQLWQSNIFGKSVYDLIQENLSSKLITIPEEVRAKFRGTLTRITNEGANGLLCLIL